tara:strand:- start:42339 stop:43247 length:909 start_codon:yes stop_codon:yes gene_type:complete
VQIQRRLFLTLCILFLTNPAAYAGAVDDASAEKPQILRQGSVTKGYEALPVGEQTIAAAYLSQTLGIPRGAVLLLHDINEHIDSAAVGLLRRQLPSYGWNTLAIKIIRFSEDTDQSQLTAETEATVDPVEAVQTAEVSDDNPADDAEAPVDSLTAESSAEIYKMVTTAERIDAALLKLQQEGHENIVLIGQGAGGRLALKALNETAVPVTALVMINTGALSEGIGITDVTIPTLEIMGSRQKDEVKQAILQRQTQMKTEQRTNYHLRQITGADHYFSSAPKQLTNQVHGWLVKQLLDEEASQ